MRNLYSIALIAWCVLFHANCTHELEIVEHPDQLISADSMELILSEMMLIESYVRVKHINVKDYHEVMLRSGNELLAKYEVDSLRYMESLEYYSKKQEILDEIYEGVKLRLKLDSIDLGD